MSILRLMIIQDVLNHFHTENDITAEIITAIQNTADLRTELIAYSRLNGDRAFAIALLDKFIAIRKTPDGNMPVEDLMLACYNLALHNTVEDCLIIWEAKNADFDTYCGLDLQLVLFAGFEKTIDFLQQHESFEALDVAGYIDRCKAADDLDGLENYFSPNILPWYL